MEDAHIACLDLVADTSRCDVDNASRVGRDGINQKDIALFGVFDGHGGDFMTNRQAASRTSLLTIISCGSFGVASFFATFYSHVP